MLRTLGLMLPVVFAVGCAPCPSAKIEPIPPRDAREAMQRVRDNLEVLSRIPLRTDGLVTFNFRDAEGRRHSYPLQDATLIFQSPRRLRFSIKHSLAGSVARVGSNDEKYWLWIEPEVSTMWWGEWRYVESGGGSSLPLPPNQVLDALMLRPLPESVGDGLPPLLREDGDGYRLLYLRLDADGWPYVAQEVALDCCPPYQPTELIVRRADGQVVMRSQLRNYRQLGEDGPYVAHRYVIDWPQDEAELRIDFHGARLNPDQVPFYHFPDDPPVEKIESLDAAAPAGASRLTFESAPTCV